MCNEASVLLRRKREAGGREQGQFFLLQCRFLRVRTKKTGIVWTLTEAEQGTVAAKYLAFTCWQDAFCQTPDLAVSSGVSVGSVCGS